MSGNTNDERRNSVIAIFGQNVASIVTPGRARQIVPVAAAPDNGQRMSLNFKSARRARESTTGI